MGSGDGKHLVPVLNLTKTFEDHERKILTIAAYPDGKRIATGSYDGTIRIWRLEDGREMKKWVVKKNDKVRGLLISKDGTQIIGTSYHVGGRRNQELWVRDAETGRIIAALDGHSDIITTWNIFHDGGTFARGSFDHTVIFWDATTWKRNGILDCGAPINHIRFSQTGQLGVATHKDIQIWDLGRMERIAQLNDHHDVDFDNGRTSLAWTRDGLHLLSVGRASGRDPIIRSWDTSTWKQAGGPWTASGHNQGFISITLNQAGTLLASISSDDITSTIRLWALSTRTEVAMYEHLPRLPHPARFSEDDRFIFSKIGNKLLQWEIPEDVLATACGGSLVTASMTANAGPSLCNQKNAKSLLDMDIPGQRRAAANKDLANLGRSRPWIIRTPSPIKFGADVDGLPSSRVNGIPNIFNRMRPSLNTKGKERQRRANIMTPETVDVPFGLATYGDYVAGDEDRIRPYSLFFCLGWFQKKKKLDPPLQLYDVDIMKAEQDHDPLNVPAPATTGVADG